MCRCLDGVAFGVVVLVVVRNGGSVVFVLALWFCVGLLLRLDMVWKVFRLVLCRVV